MAKKKGKKYGRFIAMVVITILILAMAGFAAAEQEWLPGYGDKNGTLGKDKQSWRIGYINTLVGEGATSNTIETFLEFADPTGSDNTQVFQDASGTIALTESIASTTTLADTKILIGQSTGLAAAQSVTTGHAITNAGDLTHVANTVSSTDILNSTIAAIDMAANSIGTAALNVSTVNVPVSVGSASGTATVTSGSTILGFYPFANINDEVANIVSISSTTLTLTQQANATVDVPVWRVVILEP